MVRSKAHSARPLRPVAFDTAVVRTMPMEATELMSMPRTIESTRTSMLLPASEIRDAEDPDHAVKATDAFAAAFPQILTVSPAAAACRGRRTG